MADAHAVIDEVDMSLDAVIKNERNSHSAFSRRHYDPERDEISPQNLHREHTHGDRSRNGRDHLHHSSSSGSGGRRRVGHATRSSGGQSDRRNGDKREFGASYGPHRGYNRRRADHDPYNGSSSRNNRRRSGGRAGGPRQLTVSGETHVKAVAGAIAHITRQEQAPVVLAGGAAGVNQAIKAISVARQFLKDDDLDLSCACENSRDMRKDRKRQDVGGYRLILSKNLRQSPADFEQKELKVKSTSESASVAGAIANRIRNSERIFLSSIGPESCFRAVRAIAIARTFLIQDGWDLSFRPEFMNVEVANGQTSTALKFTVLARQI